MEKIYFTPGIEASTDLGFNRYEADIEDAQIVAVKTGKSEAKRGFAFVDLSYKGKKFEWRAAVSRLMGLKNSPILVEDKDGKKVPFWNPAIKLMTLPASQSVEPSFRASN